MSRLPELDALLDDRSYVISIDVDLTHLSICLLGAVPQRMCPRLKEVAELTEMKCRQRVTCNNENVTRKGN